MSERLFIDTVFVIGLLSASDQQHEQAKRLLPRIQAASEVWTTEAVLTEVANGLAVYDRLAAAGFIEQCYRLSPFRVVAVDSPLFQRAIAFYKERPDKEWGLTDCISFVVMQQNEITLAATSDRHFIQAGFTTLMVA